MNPENQKKAINILQTLKSAQDTLHKKQECCLCEIKIRQK